jgi:hypothetical protein
MHFCTNPCSFSVPMRPWGDPTVIVIGYFDGETEGLLRCSICGQAFRFQLVDWDKNQDERIFSLTRVVAPTYEAILSTLAKAYGEPSTRYWVPNNSSLTNVAREAVNNVVADLLRDSNRPEAVLLTEHIEREILSLAILKQEIPLESTDWWTVLRPRQPPE